MLRSTYVARKINDCDFVICMSRCYLLPLLKINLRTKYLSNSSCAPSIVERAGVNASGTASVCSRAGFIATSTRTQRARILARVISLLNLQSFPAIPLLKNSACMSATRTPLAMRTLISAMFSRTRPAIDCITTGACLNIKTFKYHANSMSLSLSELVEYKFCKHIRYLRLASGDQCCNPKMPPAAPNTSACIPPAPSTCVHPPQSETVWASCCAAGNKLGTGPAHQRKSAGA